MSNSKKSAVSGKTIGRLSLYRRILYGLMADGERFVFSHQLAALVGGSAAQVRRDVMAVGYTGSPTRGYDVNELARAIGNFLDAPAGQSAALIGVGNLGRAILAYFSGRRPKLSIKAAFDVDSGKVNRVIHGCRCHHLDDLEVVVKELGITIAVITVPADQAQAVTEKLVRAGVCGLVNFAPVRLWVPGHVHVEDIDMTTSLEKAAYFARERALESVSERGLTEER
jgi:redox-sensing transcriptional repressor